MSNEEFKQLNIVYIALAGGQLMFFGVVFYLVSYGNGEFPLPHDAQFFGTLEILAAIICPVCVAAAYYIFKKRKEAILAAPDREQPLDYRAASIVKWALIEGSSFFSIIGYLITGEMIFATTFILSFTIFLLNRPKQEGFKGHI